MRLFAVLQALACAGVLAVTASVASDTASTVKPPTIVYKAKGTKCVVTHWNELEEPTRFKAITTWEMWFPEKEKLAVQMKAKARLGPNTRGTWLSAPWGPQIETVKYPSPTWLRVGKHWDLSAHTYSVGYGADWNIEVELFWERRSPGIDWKWKKRIRFNEATCPATKRKPPPPSPRYSDWKGTVRVVTDMPKQTQTFESGTVFEYSRHDEATYTLTGKRPDGLYDATMVGSGTGRGTNTFPGICTATADPHSGWTYNGPATVQISRGAAPQGGYEYTLRPRGAQGTVQNFYLNPTCAGGPEDAFAMVLPPNIEETNPTIKVQDTNGGDSLVQYAAARTFSWKRNDTDTIAGTMTVTWSIFRERLK